MLSNDTAISREWSATHARGWRKTQPLDRLFDDVHVIAGTRTVRRVRTECGQGLDLDLDLPVLLLTV